MFVYLYPDTSELLGPAWIQIVVWFGISIAILGLIRHRKLVYDWQMSWRRNWLVGVFVCYAMFSVIWSTNPMLTFYRSLDLLFATLAGAYIGIRYRPTGLMSILFWFGAVMFTLSIAIVYYAPPTGVMSWSPFFGAWRGVYWNRNHLATLAALVGGILVCRIVAGYKTRNNLIVFDGLIYAVAWVVLWYAKSATGFLLAIILHGCILAFLLWTKYSGKIDKRIYNLMRLLVVVTLIVALVNINFILGLFGRDITLTGRVGLWAFLVREVIPAHPWFGHGFGVLWASESFRVYVQQNIGWGDQPLIGDNGFLDITLHLGVLGLGLLLLILVKAVKSAWGQAISTRSIEGFVPLLILVYALIANIPFSLFAETEVFIWMLVVTVCFMTVPGRRHPLDVSTS
jgi:hypothetical protein